MKRLALLSIALGALLVGVGGSLPGIAAAAPAAKLLGQNPIAEGEQGGCACSAVQLADTGTPSSYVFPFSGVLTKTQFYVGTTTEAGQWVKAQTFRTSGPADATVISQGEQHNLNGLTSGGHMFLDRIPAVAGDVLGARFNDSPLISDTPAIFKASPSDLAGRGIPGTEPGGSFTAMTSPGWRVNAVATLEPDEDGDGYGDSSQDLCPASPVVATACSGTLFGSGLVGLHSSFTNCGFACLNIQKSIGGHPTTAAQDGVVVRWRLLGAETGTYHVRVVAPTGSSQYTILHSSSAESVASEPQISEKIYTFPTRLPIPAGGYVALAAPLNIHLGFRNSGSLATYEDINDHIVDGAVVSTTGTTTGELLYDADIEPDADHDGYGDVTQDACPSSGSTQGACPPSSGGGSGSNPKSSPAKKPEISGLKATPSHFRVKQGGAAISTRSAHAGTTLKLTLSEKAKVAFTLQKSLTCKAPTKAKRCAATKSASPLRLFARDLPEGKSKIPFSGLYKSGKKVRALKPGSYTLTAVATNGAGKASAPSQAKLTVVGAPQQSR